MRCFRFSLWWVRGHGQSAVGETGCLRWFLSSYSKTFDALLEGENLCSGSPSFFLYGHSIGVELGAAYVLGFQRRPQVCLELAAIRKPRVLSNLLGLAQIGGIMSKSFPRFKPWNWMHRRFQRIPAEVERIWMTLSLLIRSAASNAQMSYCYRWESIQKEQIFDLSKYYWFMARLMGLD